jgi:hypothetical protein
MSQRFPRVSAATVIMRPGPTASPRLADQDLGPLDRAGYSHAAQTRWRIPTCGPLGCITAPLPQRDPGILDGRFSQRGEPIWGASIGSIVADRYLVCDRLLPFHFAVGGCDKGRQMVDRSTTSSCVSNLAVGLVFLSAGNLLVGLVQRDGMLTYGFDATS